jgi:hypothetical protein
LNLQYFIRVAACAAIVALVLTGAGLFPAQSAAGQETTPGSLLGAAAIEQLKKDGQYNELQSAMKQARFSVSRAEETPLGRYAWHAPNPVAGYDAYITEEGVSIAVSKSYVSLTLQGIGYGKALRAVARGEVSADNQTINIRRDGGVQEWYVNGPEGLEQGFTLAEAPGIRQAGVPLRLALQLSEGWGAEAREDSQQVTLRNVEGQAVDYGKLSVRDQMGRSIPARLAVIRKQVVIEVEDSEATYPLTIDPTFSLQQKLIAADPEFYDYLGYSVAISGDTLVTGAVYDNIGSNLNQGSAYVFTRTGTVWTFQDKLVANDGLPYDYFGGSVAINGDTVVVGAWAATIGANSGQGSAYVFTRSGGVWTQQQKLTADDGAYGDYFGESVALSGNTVAVGAHGDSSTPPHVQQGSVYVFTRSGTVWTQQKKIIAADNDTQDSFGTSVSLSGNTLAIGARHASVNGNHAQGAVYVFVGSGSFWNVQQKLTANDGAKDDYFGWSVSLSGNTVAVGSRYDDIGTNIDQGSAYIFTRLGTHWTQQQKLIANDGAGYDLFGYSVALSGDTVAIGAKDDSVGTTPLQGSAYVFNRSFGGWTQQQKLVASDGLMWDEFGAGVALDDKTLAVGMPGDDTGPILHHGSVYVFLGPPPCAPLAFSPSSLPNGGINTPYQQSVTITGGTGPYKFTLASGGGFPPPGISMSVFGVLSGTPTTMGDYQFRIIATDWSSACSASRDYTITIGSCPTLILSPQALPDGTMGTPYNVAITATGGIAPYKFGFQGALPPGLSLSSYGVLSGTPTIDGDFSFRVVILDANACSTVREVRMAIIKAESDPCSTIMLEPPTLPDGMVDKDYFLQLTPTGGREPYTFTVQGTLPPGLSLTPEGYLIGTPTEDGGFYFRLVIGDARGCFRTFECPITILKAD